MSDVRKHPRAELTFDNERAFERHVLHVAATGSVEELGRLVDMLKARGELRVVRTEGEESDPERSGGATD